MKKVLKYGTGQEISDGAEYLYTLKNGVMSSALQTYYVWHYFLVEVEE